MLTAAHFAAGVLIYTLMTSQGCGTLESMGGALLSHKVLDTFKDVNSPGRIKIVVSLTDTPERNKSLFSTNLTADKVVAGLLASSPDILKSVGVMDDRGWHNGILPETINLPPNGMVFDILSVTAPLIDFNIGNTRCRMGIFVVL